MPFQNTFGSFSRCECGLIYETNDWNEPCVPIPLKHVEVQVKVVDFIADVTVRQTYRNEGRNPLESIYMFPVDEAACMIGFEAHLNGRIIKGNVKEIEAAQKEYREAVDSGHASYLVTENKPDIFQIKVGMLQPDSETTIELRYLTELKVERKAVRFYLPTTVAPRYIPHRDTSKEARDIANIPYTNISPAKLSITVELEMKSRITNVTSPTHRIVSKRHNVWGLEGVTTEMDRDFVLLVESQEPHQPRLYVEKYDDSVAAMVSLVPAFEEKIRQSVELVFLLDRSGSMGGKSIELAKKALQIFVRSLPVNSFFNIVGFGNSVVCLFKESVKYSKENSAVAMHHIDELSANLGGTNIYEPLKTILTMPTIEGYVRQVLVLTDGEVSNTDEVIGLVSMYSSNARIFCLGVGDSASHYLVQGIATAGHGTAEFATYNEKLDAKVQKQLSQCLQPALTNVNVQWQFQNDKFVDKMPSPFKVPPIFDRSRMLTFCIWKGTDLPNSVRITGMTSAGKEKAYHVECTSSDLRQGKMIHQMAARKLIRELEVGTSYLHNNKNSDKEEVKRVIVDLACKYGLVSRYTAIVAVDSTETGKLGAWAMQTKQVPNQIPHGYGGGRLRRPPIPIRGHGFVATDGIRQTVKSNVATRLLELGRPQLVAQSGTTSRAKISTLSYVVTDSISSPPEIPESSLDSLLDRLLALQQFDGRFEANAKIANIFGISWDDIKNECKTETEEVWVTALAVKYLEMSFIDDKDTWELIAEKTHLWIEQNAINKAGVLLRAEDFLTKVKKHEK